VLSVLSVCVCVCLVCVCVCVCVCALSVLSVCVCCLACVCVAQCVVFLFVSEGVLLVQRTHEKRIELEIAQVQRLSEPTDNGNCSS